MYATVIIIVLVTIMNSNFLRNHKKAPGALRLHKIRAHERTTLRGAHRPIGCDNDPRASSEFLSLQDLKIFILWLRITALLYYAIA